MKKMVHLMHSDGMGGGPVVVNQMIRDFSKTFEVIAIVGGKGKVTEFCKKTGLAVHSIAIDKLWKCSFGFFQLFFLLVKIRPDVMFLHGQWASPLGALAGKLTGVPVMIYVAHSPAFYHRQTFKNTVRGYLSEIIPCRFSDAIIALSQGNRYQYLIRQWAREDTIHLIHNGLDLPVDKNPKIGNEVRARWNWNPKHRHVLFLGRLDHQKGLGWLLPAWQRVSRQYPCADLWIVGSGPQEKEVRLWARDLKVEESCHFVPDQPDGRIFLEAADIVVLPSLYEGHALVPLETMAAGKAFIGTRVDGIVDSVRDGEDGLLVSPGDIEGLAAAMGRLIDDPLLCEELGKGALKRIRDFNWEESFKQYDELVQTLLRNKAK